MCVSSFLPFGKMLSEKKHAADNFLLKFQDEAKRFVNIYHFGIEPTGFQTVLTNYFLKQSRLLLRRIPSCKRGK